MSGPPSPRPKAASSLSRSQQPLLVVALFVGAVLLYSFRLTENPLWLDELIAYQLGIGGPNTILASIRYEPHPPLFYLLQWAAAGFGSAWGTSWGEWAWRWPSVLSGALVIPLTYYWARDLVSQRVALLAALLLAITPSMLYFSQEARPYAFLTLLHLLSLFVLTRLQQGQRGLGTWAAFVLLALFGLYSNYNYALIVGVQLLYLAIVTRRWRAVAGATAVILIMLLPVLLLATDAFGREWSSSPADRLTVVRVLQSLLAGEPLRYGTTWAHLWMPLVVGALVGLGVVAWSRVRTPRIVLYHILLVGLAPLTVFVLLGALDYQPRLKDVKQFLVLLPSVFLLLALGMEELTRWGRGNSGFLLVLVPVALLVLGSWSGMARYWSTSKSPEGLLVQEVAAQWEEEDALIVLHYSPRAAVSFYLPEMIPYHDPLTETADEIILPRGQIVIGQPSHLTEEPLERVAEHHARLWVIALEGQTPGWEEALTAHCPAVNEWSEPPFIARLFDCR